VRVAPLAEAKRTAPGADAVGAEREVRRALVVATAGWPAGSIRLGAHLAARALGVALALHALRTAHVAKGTTGIGLSALGVQLALGAGAFDANSPPRESCAVRIAGAFPAARVVQAAYLLQGSRAGAAVPADPALTIRVGQALHARPARPAPHRAAAGQAPVPIRAFCAGSVVATREMRRAPEDGASCHDTQNGRDHHTRQQDAG